jgi:hypothetical protein
VLVATVLGARLAAAGDDRVEYWSVRSAATPGDVVSRDDLRPAKVRLPAGSADGYIRTDEEFDAPLDELVWAHALTPGSLVGKDSLVARSSRSRGQLPLSVTAGASPFARSEGAAAGGSMSQTVLVDVDESQLGTDVVSTVATGHVTLVRIA